MKIQVLGYDATFNEEWDVDVLPRSGDYLQYESKYYKVAYVVFSRSYDGEVGIQVHVGSAMETLPSSR